MPRTIEEINKKIVNGEANIFTAEEIKDSIKNEGKLSFNDVDVVTTGTCGIMSGTAAIFHISVTKPGVFQKARKVYLNGVPAFPGPCPNELLGSIDLIVHGTEHSIKNHHYGGGFLFKDILNGEKIDLELEAIDGAKFEKKITLEDIQRAQLLGTRMAFKNYTAFINPKNDVVNSIFNGIPMKGGFDQFTFSGCGELNPIQNNVSQTLIKQGTKILLNGAKGMVIGSGTRSSDLKPNLMLTADMLQMSGEYVGGFKTGAGSEIYDSIAIPLPILNEKIFKEVQILNSDIPLTIADIHGRHLPLSETNYGVVWDGRDERPAFNFNSFNEKDNENIKESCPTNAINENGTIDLDKCFGCGLCVHLSKNTTYTMNIGSLNFDIDDKSFNVPITCRQSDIQRARKIAIKLKQLIGEGEFEL
ncbi:MAG: methanogenesis marker 16 metalloprotein [Methanobrevibacter sp.]|jgi:putative methanogenesis marker 16 metalloprotein|nr:methanogenesis marker 16 metalloprotein [Candidatus Methanovirga basalitermitum]